MKTNKAPLPGMPMVRRVNEDRPTLGWGIYLETIDGGKRVDSFTMGGVEIPIGFHTKKAATIAMNEIGMLVYPPRREDADRVYEICCRLTDKQENRYLNGQGHL